MSPRKVKTNIYIDAPTLKALKDISKRTMIPMASLIRKGIEQVIREYSKK
jgi:hypothetical protein